MTVHAAEIPTPTTQRLRSAQIKDLLCVRIAEEIARNPAWLERAATHLASDRYTSSYEDVWRMLIAAGPAAVIAALTSPSADADPIKSDNPFAVLGIVSERDRIAIVNQVYAVAPRKPQPA